MNERLAIAGGRPVRKTLLPYGHQSIDDDDVRSVVEALKSDWLTTGPKVSEFEHALADAVGTSQAVAVSSGTAALHAAMYAIGVGPGDEVIVPAMTFAASANCVVYQGATPVFADVEQDTLLVAPESVENRITPRTKAIVAVDYAGQPCDYDALRQICGLHGLSLVADACHAIGGSYQGAPVGSLADLSTFSFHPVKHITSGEGGAVTTADESLADSMRRFRNHGITTDHRQRAESGDFFYEMTDLGWNYRITDMQCALGSSQLAKLDRFVRRRQEIAAEYDSAFAQVDGVNPLHNRPSRTNAYHLYVVALDLSLFRTDRLTIFRALRAEGIGVNVHYVPVHLHPFYRERFGTEPGICPVAEAAYEHVISLPMFPAMSDDDLEDVVNAVTKVVEYYRA